MTAEAVYAALSESRILRDYEAAFRAATGLSLKLLPSEVRSKRQSLGREENPFCSLVTESPGGCEACLKVQSEAQKRLGAKLAPQQLRCFAGLTDVAVPVVVGGRSVATLYGGQVFLAKPTRHDFSRLTKELIEWGLRTDLHRIEEAYFHTRVVSHGQFQAMVQLLTIFAQHLAEAASQAMIAKHHDEPSSVTLARGFIQERIGKQISMRAAAQHVHLSAYYFCKLFKKATGMTFTEHVARVRVEKAKDLLADPHLRVSDAAYAAGFQSIPNFNRVFRKYAGLSPTTYRGTLQKRLHSSL